MLYNHKLRIRQYLFIMGPYIINSFDAQLKKIHSLFMNVIQKIINALFFDTFDSMPGTKTGY